MSSNKFTYRRKFFTVKILMFLLLIHFLPNVSLYGEEFGKLRAHLRSVSAKKKRRDEKALEAKKAKIKAREMRKVNKLKLKYMWLISSKTGETIVFTSVIFPIKEVTDIVPGITMLQWQDQNGEFYAIEKSDSYKIHFSSHRPKKTESFLNFEDGIKN